MPTPEAQPPHFSFPPPAGTFDGRVKQLERALGMATEQNAKLKTEVDYLLMHNESLKYELRKENEAVVRELKIELTLKEEIERLQEQNKSFQRTIKTISDKMLEQGLLINRQEFQIQHLQNENDAIRKIYR